MSTMWSKRIILERVRSNFSVTRINVSISILLTRSSVTCLGLCALTIFAGTIMILSRLMLTTADPMTTAPSMITPAAVELPSCTPGLLSLTTMSLLLLVLIVSRWIGSDNGGAK